MISDVPPVSEATTGIPVANASRQAVGSPSMNEGRTRTDVSCKRSAIRLWLTSPKKEIRPSRSLDSAISRSRRGPAPATLNIASGTSA